jgi:type VI secretion system protein
MLGTSQRFFVLPFRRRSPGRLAVALLLLWALGCGANRRSFFGGDISVQVKADPEINQNSPVAVEAVVVYDEDLLKALLAKSAQDWFRDREQIGKDHPGGKDFVSMRWEVVPGQTLEKQEMSFGSGARGGIVFADYFSEGAHRSRFEPHLDLTIHLQDSDFSLEQPK